MRTCPTPEIGNVTITTDVMIRMSLTALLLRFVGIFSQHNESGCDDVR